MTTMRTRWMLAVTMLLAATAPTAAETPAEKIKRLEAENARLRAELAQARRQLAQRKTTAGAPAAAVRSRQLQIRVVKGGWGGAGTTDIQKVLHSAAMEIWKYFPERKLPPIIVQHSNSGPIVLYRKGPKGEHIVRLDVEGTYWAQFAYQFAHEFCHILTNYHPAQSKKNNWFLESLCEMASRFAVRGMAETWKTAPPYPHWKSFSSALTKYADNLRLKPGQGLAEGQTLAQWYRANASALRAKATDRAKNKVVANAVLPILQANPETWQAFSHLNLIKPDKADTFEAFLSDWLARTPAEHKPAVKRIIALFDLKSP